MYLFWAYFDQFRAFHVRLPRITYAFRPSCTAIIFELGGYRNVKAQPRTPFWVTSFQRRNSTWEEKRASLDTTKHCTYKPWPHTYEHLYTSKKYKRGRTAPV